MRYRLLSLAVLLSLSFAVAGADGFKPPPMKDGLWEVHSTQTQEGKALSDTSVKMCLSQELTESMQTHGEELRTRNQCTSSVTQPSPGTYVEESRCAKGANAGSVTKVIYTYQGDTASHMEMHMNVGKAETVVITDSKYAGSCPTGMKPGDLMMGGKIISGGN